jgi:DNA-binding MarR family transcriptional regulator
MIIEEAIKQKHFPYPGQKAAINLLYSASWLGGEMKKALDPFDISWQQFNILRILKGQKEKPASLKLLTERMIDDTSNTSRLIDKLVKKELVKRISCPKDRRQVDISLTDRGHQIVENATKAMDNQMDSVLGHMDDVALLELSDLLDRLRTPDFYQ